MNRNISTTRLKRCHIKIWFDDAINEEKSALKWARKTKIWTNMMRTVLVERHNTVKNMSLQNSLTAICSLVWTGWNPTNGICIDSIVPITYTYRKQKENDVSFGLSRHIMKNKLAWYRWKSAIFTLAEIDYALGQVVPAYCTSLLPKYLFSVKYVYFWWIIEERGHTVE